jgi:hypothetical protein
MSFSEERECACGEPFVARCCAQVKCKKCHKVVVAARRLEDSRRQWAKKKKGKGNWKKDLEFTNDPNLEGFIYF